MTSGLPSSRTQKLGNTQRLTKQLSQGSVNFVTTKTNASTKSVVRLSENSLS